MAAMAFWGSFGCNLSKAIILKLLDEKEAFIGSWQVVTSGFAGNGLIDLPALGRAANKPIMLGTVESSLTPLAGLETQKSN